MSIAAIDPGKTGGLAIIYDDGLAITLEVPVAGKKPAWTQWARTWGFALSEAMPSRIGIEAVSAMPKQGVTSMFNFGETLGFVHGICLIACPQAVIEWPTPAAWKKKLGLSADKTESHEEARRLFPGCSSELARVKDNGRAEALLIAYYLRNFR